jgi:hypothetical protein
MYRPPITLALMAARRDPATLVAKCLSAIPVRRRKGKGLFCTRRGV